MKKVYLGCAGQPLPTYADALRSLGAAAEYASPDGCDALLLPGGGDIHPRFYGRDIAGATGIDEARDERELALFRRFAEQGRPILGVCRGLQLINVACGGTLRRHIDGHSQINGRDTFHAVHSGDALLCGLYGARFTVNSAHHQAADLPGAGLREVAWAEDGTVEALRHKTLPILAVQWHPERLGAEGARLIAAFLEWI